jgi:LAO/AO transport system kinase
MHAELELMLQLRPPGGWSVPVVSCVASEGRGVDEVLTAIQRHHAYLGESGDGAARAAAARHEEFVAALRDELGRRVEAAMRDGAVAGLLEQVERGEIDPYAALRRVLGDRGVFDAVVGNPDRSED